MKDISISVFDESGKQLGVIRVRGDDVTVEDTKGSHPGAAYRAIRVLLSEFGGSPKLSYAQRLRNLAESGETTDGHSKIEVQR